MDPLSIISASVGLASVIAKVSMTLASFARDARDAAKDLDAISAELKAISTVIALLGRSLSPSSAESPIPEALLQQIDVMLSGTTAVVEQVQENVQKYQSNKMFSKANWAMFGQGDMRKLRESLEAYKMALSLGMHVVSSTVNQAVKEDTSAIHEYAVAIKMNTEDILARVNSIRRDGQANRHKRIEDWIEDMSVLSSYADTAYQGTIMDPADIADMAAISESDSESETRLSEDSGLSPSPGGPPPDHSQHTTAAQSRGADPGGSSTQHAARLTLGEISAPSTPSGPTTAPSGISADNLDSSTPTSALTRNSEDIDGTGNDTSHRLSLFGWKSQTSLQKPPLGPPGTGESLLFRTALKCFQHSSEALVPRHQPSEPHHHCEVSLFEWLPTSEASAMENAPSLVFFTVTLPPNLSETPAGDEEVILIFFDAKGLQEFRGHLMGSSPRLDETRHEFALAGYNALEYGGLGTSARIPRPILLAMTHTWLTVSIFAPSTLGPPHRLVVESQDGLTFINIRTGPQYHKFIRLSSIKADDCLLVISQSLISGSRCNFLLFIGSPGSAKLASINGKELQGFSKP
ncbi:hypothetical protein B0T18DRAFT_386988 [Schizothecium vesticola]|uniref:Azaphilone pigments biosynthesis cluster protein L N-terminal domain-containing protein n=1 Tax=Schizothecium vesticola TaxID=314040 RepID=A0AA40K964_9PEZI|nr:hypothetical protein B0T18DRAFT_386988 [Schizothecium vesticola]